MANLFLRRGSLANLAKAPKVDGAISFTTDEPAIYLDVAGADGVVTRKRVGDLIQVNKIADLVYDPKTMTGVATDKTGLVSEWSDSALYYAIEENALLKCIKDGETYKWIQVNATSDIQADITSLTGTVNGIVSDLEGVHTSLDNITKDGVLIDQAQTAAEQTAAADAQTKAEAAEKNAKDYADGKIATLTDTVNGKVDKTAYETKVKEIEDDIDEVAKSVTDLTNGAVKDLQDAVGVPASEGVNASGLYKAIADEVTRATGAEEALGKRIDGVNTTIEGIQTSVSNAATKTELATTKSDLEKYADQAETDAISSANVYTNGKIAEVNAEVAKKADKTATETAIGNITNPDTGLIAVAKKEAIATAAQDATDKVDAAKVYAKNYADSINTTLTGLIDSKADKTATETALNNITKPDTGLIAVAKQEAITAAAADAKTKADAAEKNAKVHADAEIVKVNAEIAKKADTETVNTQIGDLNKAIKQAKTDAANDATKKANDAQAAAEQTAANALSSAKTEIQGKLDTKVETETFNTTVGTLETKTDAAAKLAEAKAYTDQALAAADAMTFRGVVGGEGNNAALPTTEVKGGDTYKVGAIGTYADEGVSYVGDLLIAKRDQAADEAVYAGGWYHVSSGYEDDYSERFVADDENATVKLMNTVDQAHGTVQFKADENSNVEISMVSTYDEATKSNNSIVTVGMVWGEF